MKITFIGGGNMATALIGGLIQKGHAAAGLTVIEPAADKRAQLEQQFGVSTRESLATGLADADCVLLAVKPQQLKEVATGLAPLLRNEVVISIAAGIRIGSLSGWLGGYDRIVRVMPNTPALVQAGVSGLFAASGVPAAVRAMAGEVMSSVGAVVWVDDEAKMDAVTAVSGSGPAYVFYFLEALEQSALDMGFDAAAARLLAYETFNGAIKLALSSQDDAATLRARVTSKGGTTEAALKSMQIGGVKQAIMAGVSAACVRSKTLGDELCQD